MTPTTEPLVAAVRADGYVSGYTHGFYRYPARFSPEFARRLIEQYTEPGDIVLDPFVGGGTTAVEALASGRRVIGLDLNPLAHFVTLVKTTPLSGADHDALRRWATLPMEPNVRSTEADLTDPRLRNLPSTLLNTLASFTASAATLRPSRRRRFARCVLLRVGQWALESRQDLPSTEDVRAWVVTSTDAMLAGLSEFLNAAAAQGVSPAQVRRNRRLVNTTTALGYWLRGARRTGIPRLVLTSPPYPGVHVLYHRWQVLGRRETPAPFWLTDLKDGRGESFYRFGSRTPTGLRNYFTTLGKALSVVRQVIAPDTVVAQLIAFSDVEQQLPRYLAEMDAAGYQPLADTSLPEQEALWRRVPHRRWYMRIKDPRGEQAAANEVLLLHRLADGRAPVAAE